MSAIIRVKRRIDEEPLNAFVLNCKKRKIVNDNGAEENSSSASASSVIADKNTETETTVVKFAGTIQNPVS